MPKGDGLSERSGGDRASLIPGGGLVIAVLAVLLFAAARQVAPAALKSTTATTTTTIDLAAPAPAPPRSDPPPPSTPEAESDSNPASSPATTEKWTPARVAPQSAVVLDPLARRTLEDPMRLSRAGAYTLQIAVACRKDTALRLLDRAGSAGELYVLPAPSNGQECWRFCWGAFDARDRAAHATLPESLARAGLGTPAPRRVEELVP